MSMRLEQSAIKRMVCTCKYCSILSNFHQPMRWIVSVSTLANKRVLAPATQKEVCVDIACKETEIVSENSNSVTKGLGNFLNVRGECQPTERKTQWHC